MNIAQTVREARKEAQSLETARNWHDNHYERTTPDNHPGRWRRFIEIDPFNPKNRLEGHIQMQGGDEYGTLAIQTVNGKPAPQFIRTMPKATYPFFKDGSWVLTGMDSLEAYCKLDGTNICQFCYQDAQGREFTSFKVRIRPFMAPHFINLMEKCFELYPGVRDRKLRPRQACMYELYGHENPMLIHYGQPVDLALLLAREPDGRIVTLQEAENPIFLDIDCPRADHRPIAEIDDVQREYRRRQDELTEELTPLTDEQFRGQEGEMLYATFPDGARTEPGGFTRLVKLKAHQIEEIHWAKDHISKEEIQATARNTFELADNPGEQEIIQLLAEDWNEKQIERSMETIQRVMRETVDHRGYQDRILRLYHESHSPNDFRDDPKAVMRSLSRHFGRKEMSQVYSALVERGLASPAHGK